MAEYIEREAAMNIFGDVPMWDGYYEPYTWEVHCAMVGAVKLIKEELNKVPAADVAPVTHGEWTLIGADKRGRGGIWRCSACRKTYPCKCDYCPNCGAKMDGGAENG